MAARALASAAHCGRAATLLAVAACLLAVPAAGNRPPSFSKDMDQLVLSEAAAVGSVVYQLAGSDPENSPLRFGLAGTDRFEVDAGTGEVRVARPLDREQNDTLRFFVTLEDQVEGGGGNNVVQVPVTVIVLDENDNPPVFRGIPYEVTVPEDTPVSSTVFPSVLAEDLDLVGEILEVSCSDLPQFPDACSKFEVVTLNASERAFQGAVVLRQQLDYSMRQFYQMSLVATDGKHESRTPFEVRVEDVQNTPPIFVGSLAGVVHEDAPIGTLIMTVQARDGDRGRPRKITYQLVTNPLNYFLLDPETGELRTAKPLDKEALPDSTGVLTISVRARELVNGSAAGDPLTEATTDLTITIKDVNDEAPHFNRREYSTAIPENVPQGTPLPHLDMLVSDPDVGINSAFTLRLEDISKAFQVEPESATGSTSVSIRVANGSLDYENPNQRKFIILVIAEESQTNPRLSSTATVTVTITDANDNAPHFDREAYTASIVETASPHTVVTTITARDRDSGRFGENGLIYSLFGEGSENFTVNNKTGVITVAECPTTPGASPCLDFETRPVYYLSYKATDDDGKGLSTNVPLKITLIDSNDNKPQFLSNHYRVAIDEGATRFEPQLQVQARDLDKTSEIAFSIVDGNVNNMFSIDPHSGELTINNLKGVDMTNISKEDITLTIQANDGMFSSTATVQIVVRDVNNNAPAFVRENYIAFVQEDAPIGTSVEQIDAVDADSGINAEIKYHVQKGAYDDFSVDESSGLIQVSNKLDFDRRSQYSIELIAVDGGTPSLTGTTTVAITVLNSNDKDPVFDPPTQRAEVSEDASQNTVFYTLKAKDPDVNSSDALNFALAEPITAVDKNGKQVTDSDDFKSFFAVDRATGEVSVARELQREIAAIVRLTVLVTDITAPTTQQGKGILVITIIDVNDFAPTFPRPWTPEDPHYTVELLEEQPIGTVVGTFVAHDEDSKIANYALEPESEYFAINNLTGTVRTKKRVDYETTKSLNFTVVAYDSGEPQKSASADVTVNIININDMDPVFSKSQYEATVPENSLPGTRVITVKATDQDEGVFGVVIYSLVGEHSHDFSIGHESGEVIVSNPSILDRENLPELTLEVMASDSAPLESRRTVAVPIHIRVLDENDNPPKFYRRALDIQIDENVSVVPPQPITQVRAEDADENDNGAVRYTILQGNENGAFFLDSVSGILYPAISLEHQPRNFNLIIEGRDGQGKGAHSDTITVNIHILEVNQHPPVFVMPKLDATIEVPENAGLANYLVMTVKATDEDGGENGRVSYHLKVNNMNKQETDEFIINADTGELRTKIILDREIRANYSLVLVAHDHGKPTSYETLRFLTVLLVDADDNQPEFPLDDSTMPYQFRVVENAHSNMFIGRVSAIDRDEGSHATVYYHIIAGNEDGGFYVDKTNGSVFTNTSFDREQRDEYNIFIKASNKPEYFPTMKEISQLTEEHDPSVAHVRIAILDENDNPPRFQHPNYYAGVNAMTNINEFVVKVIGEDSDFGANGSLSYFIVASNLYKFGSNRSSGSIIPSPFNVTEDGRIVTANYMAEYNQERFVLEVRAKEKALPEREAVTHVHIWIYEPQQLIRVILAQTPEEVNMEQDEIVAELSNVTQSLVVVDDIRYHVDSSGRIRRDWCDMYIHVVDGPTQTIAPITDILKIIDTKYDYLKNYYAGFSIQNVVPAFVGTHEEEFDTALAALIALLIVLFVGCVTFVVVCCCLRHWVLPAPSELKKKEALIKKEIIDDLNTTENPLWIEQKLKLYEEQELTMQVFSEPEGPGMAAIPNPAQERRDSADFSQVDNTYATIQHPARRSSDDMGDYATLSGNGLHHNSSAHSSLRGTPRDMYVATLGFQGSTFQVPEQIPGNSGLDALRSRSALTINKDGQPEFVAELI